MGYLDIFVSITTGAFSEKCRAMYQSRNLEVAVSTLGHGTADSVLFDYLGLDSHEKTIQFLAMSGSQSKALLQEFRRAVHYEKRGSGIAFIIPVSGVGGKTIMEYMMNQKEDEKESVKQRIHMKVKEPEKAKAYRFDLIVAVANQGHTEDVMDAARRAGAGGGSVIHAKGTGSHYAEKFFGITLSDEKEIILIVTKTIERDKIMNAIKEDAGISSDAHTIVFSIPVENVAGIASYE